MKILSIDAWAEPEGGWNWNQWYHVGDISNEEFESLKTDKDFRLWFKRAGYTTTANKRKVGIEDDQYNICLCDRSDGRPLYAIEYGPEY